MNISNDDQRIFLENIIDTIRESLIILDEQMRVLTVNHAFLTMFQVSPEETEGRLIYELGNGQWDIPVLHHLLENIIPQQTKFENFEVRHRFETIGEKVLIFNGRRLFGADKTSVMVLLSIEDITEWYITIQKLEQTETLYRKYTEDANSIVIGLDSKGRISFFNHFSEQLFGYHRDEIHGKPFLGTIIPSVDYRGNDYTTIVNEILTIPEKFYAQECEGIRKDGGRVWFAFSAKGIRGSNGSVKEIIIDGNDITELQDARHLLNEKSAMLDTLLKFIPEGVIVCNAETIIRYASTSIEQMFKLSVTSLINTTGDECLKKINLYHSDGTRFSSYQDLPTYKAVRSGKPYSEYDLSLELDGTTRTVSIEAAPIFDSSNAVTGAVGVWHDVTRQKSAERALRESENRFRAAVDNYTSLFVIYDKNRRMQFMNRYGLQMTGLSEEQITGKSDEEIIPPEIYKHYLPYLHRAFETKKKQHFEFDVTIDGESYSYINDYVPLLYENGDVFQVLSIATDITKRKKVEKAMRESEERFRTLADNISQLAWMADTEGSIFWFNKRWYEFTGTTYDEIQQKGLAIIVHPDYFGAVMSGYVESVKKGKPWTATFPMRKHDGSYRWFLSHAMPIYDNNHTIIRWFGTNTDITELRESQQQQQIAAERFQRMLSSNIIGLVIADLDGPILSGNSYYYNLTGYSEEEFRKGVVTWKSITPSEYLPLDYRAIDQMRQSGSCSPYEKQYIRKDGTSIWVLIAFTALPGTANQCISFILDITVRKQNEQRLLLYKSRLELRAEELAEANRDLESFSYSVSHDLRGPLSAVKGFTNILEEDYSEKFDEEGRGYLKRIQLGVNKMTELINDILNLSKIGRQEVIRESIDLSSMVRNYLDDLASFEPQRKTVFAIAANITANADPHLVHLELENLLRNAWKFTSKKEVTRIEFGSIHLDGKTVFYLRDNGIGFDQKFAERIFEPFKRVHPEKEYGGTGVGLSIVQRVIKKHNGEIWAEGTPGEGAAFYFTLG